MVSCTNHMQRSERGRISILMISETFSSDMLAWCTSYIYTQKDQLRKFNWLIMNSTAWRLCFTGSLNDNSVCQSIFKNPLIAKRRVNIRREQNSVYMYTILLVCYILKALCGRPRYLSFWFFKVYRHVTYFPACILCKFGLFTVIGSIMVCGVFYR